MSNVFFISDLHFGHEHITSFRSTSGVKYRTGDDYLQNMNNIVRNWNKVVRKRDLVWVLGDVAFTDVGFDMLSKLQGRKKLVRGNHDNHFTTERLLENFETVEGLVGYKNYWLSHCPIHPKEMRGRLGNIHGHVHHNSLKDYKTGGYDERYINVCCEAVGETPIPFSKIKSGEYFKLRRC